MLLGQHCGGHEDRGLPAVEHALHHGAQGYLGLAEAHIPAQQPVHGYGGLHIRLDFTDASQLIVRLGIAEVLLKLPLPLAVRGKGVARQALALGVELDEALGHVLGRGLGAAAGLGPLGPSHLAQAHGFFLTRAGILGYHVKLCSGDIEGVAPRIVELDVILVEAVHLHAHDAREFADAVVFVHHEIARREVGIGFDALPVGGQLFARLRGLAASPDKLGVGQDREADARVLVASGHRAHGDTALSVRRQTLEGRVDEGVDALVAEKLLQGFGAPLVPGKDHDPVILFEIGRHILRRGSGRTCIARELLGSDAGEGLRLHRPSSHGEGVRHVERKLRQQLEKLLGAQAKAVGAHGHHAALLQLCHILRELLFKGSCPLAAAARLVEKEKGIFGDIVKAAGLFIQDRQISVRVREGEALVELFRVGAQGGGQSLGVLALAALDIGVGKVSDFPRYRARPAGRERGQGLQRREDAAEIEGIVAPLALHVEVGHGVDVVSPELDAHGLRVGGGEKVQDTAAPGELAGTLHLLAAGIAAAQQRLFRLLGRTGGAVPDLIRRAF